MRMNAAEIILCLDAGQSLCFEERSEYVLEPFELRTEAFKNLCTRVVAAGLAALALRCPADVDVVAHANFPWPTPSALPITRIGFDATDILKQALIDLERQRLMPERSTYSTVPPILAALDAPPSPQSNRDATLRPPCSRS